MEEKLVIEKITCMAELLTAVKDCFIQDRSIKDDIINTASKILQTELKKLKTD